MNSQNTARHDGKPSSTVLQTSGHLFIISAPSGAGKTTLRRAALNHFPDLVFSVSYTTRKPRAGEHVGVDYCFINKHEFEKGIAEDRWAEWATVHGNYYGTSAEFLNHNLAGGKDVLLEIDVQGTRKLLRRYPQSITIFIIPPSLEVLRKRLESRGTEGARAIALRLANAEKEMAQKNLYRYVVINDQLDHAVAELVAILEKHRTTA
ncbi:MAG: guanylate kinase [Desulfobacterales bacterium]|nr:MAG: guanylate kinase [Desulfobacterales bacterium]